MEVVCRRLVPRRWQPWVRVPSLTTRQCDSPRLQEKSLRGSTHHCRAWCDLPCLEVSRHASGEHSLVALLAFCCLGTLPKRKVLATVKMDFRAGDMVRAWARYLMPAIVWVGRLDTKEYVDNLRVIGSQTLDLCGVPTLFLNLQHRRLGKRHSLRCRSLSAA